MIKCIQTDLPCIPETCYKIDTDCIETIRLLDKEKDDGND